MIMFLNDNERSCDNKIGYTFGMKEVEETETSPPSILSLGSILYLCILFLPGETTQSNKVYNDSFSKHSVIPRYTYLYYYTSFLYFAHE